MQIRRDSSTQWTSVNPILAEGELGIELNTGKIKVGNGINTWNSRPYITSNLETITANLQSQINYIKSNIDPAALDSLTEIVANVNALLANNVESQLVNSGFHASLTSTGNLILDGSLLPNLHISQDLGSPTKAWRSLFLSSSTAYFGNAALTITSNGLQVLDAANQPLPIIANIQFPDGSSLTSALTGTVFPTNIVNTHSNSAVIAVGSTVASSESLSVRTINDNNALGIEVNYSSANTSSISAFRAYPDPTNIYAGTDQKLASNTDWDNFGNLTTVGDSMSFTVTDHGFHKIYRVLVIARSMPGVGGVGDAYCVIEKLKL